MIRFALAVGLVVGCVSASEAETAVRIIAPEAGILRIQRLEAGLVLGDAFAGLIGDTLSLERGTYRLQAISTAGIQPKISYFEIEVSDDAPPKPVQVNSPISSLPYRDIKGSVVHVAPAFLSQENFTLVDLATVSKESARTIMIPPPMRATNWATNISKLKSLSLEITSEPAGAEIWMDGKQLDLRTAAAFVIPLDGSHKLLPMDVLIRKEGFANQILRILPEAGQQRFEIVLTKQ